MALSVMFKLCSGFTSSCGPRARQGRRPKQRSLALFTLAVATGGALLVPAAASAITAMGKACGPGRYHATVTVPGGAIEVTEKRRTLHTRPR